MAARARGAGVEAGLVALVAEPSLADAGGGDCESDAHLAGTPVEQRARERLGRSMAAR